MYDRRLDSIIAAAELGSFSRAAAKLNISTPALVKQVSGFEAEYRVTVFKRSHAGVELTTAGYLLVADAKQLKRSADDALRRARNAASNGRSVRMGVSITSPGRQTLGLWPQVHELCPDLKLELVTVGSLYEPQRSVMLNLGETIDVVQTSYSTVRWGDACQLLHLFDVPFFVDIPRTNPLSSRHQVALSDLAGMRVCVLQHGNDPMDRLRNAMLATPDLEVVDVQKFSVALFDDAMEKGDAVLTCGAWSGIHPGFEGVALKWGEQVPTYLAYPQDPNEQVMTFVNTVAQFLE